jgi:glycerol-3-phosphate dehydrogenase
MVDKGDYCSGASTASSHMAHGGIRYLENGEFHLVQEAVHERNRMIENAPHHVQPLPTTIPIFKIWSGLLNAPLKFLNLLDRPSERGAAVIKIGLILYDSFTRRQKTVPGHKFHNRRESLQAYPKLNPEVKYTATYYDGQILSPERYCMDLIQDARAEGDHAMALNYGRAEKSDGEGVTLYDELTGKTHTVKPKVIINAAGPWIDGVNKGLGIHEQYIGGTKGSHLVLDVPELRETIGDHEFFFENKDGRIVLIFPFYDKVIIGTSDIPVEDADDVICTDDEQAYFLDLATRIFPTIAVKPEEIVYRFSGVRPLEYSKAKTTGQISRDHTIKNDHFGSIPVLSLVGGKWTSYRAFSTEVCDRVLSLLGKTRSAGTESLKVRGAEGYPKTQAEKDQWASRLAAETGLSREYSQALLERYGTFANQMAKDVLELSTEPLHSISNWTRGEVLALLKNEDVIHLDDLFQRRSSIAWLGKLNLALVSEVAEIAAPVCGWDEETRAAEIQRTVDEMWKKHGIRLNQA